VVLINDTFDIQIKIIVLMKSIRIFQNKYLLYLLSPGLLITVLLSAPGFFVSAQPSGGPYGPVRQYYEIPKVTGKIYYVAPNGIPEVKGLSPDQPTTIETAIERVNTGDAIILRGGIYRTGNLKLNQGITIQPYADEQPIFKGTYVASDWKNLKNGLWTTKWEHFFPSKPDTWWNRARFGKETPLHIFNNDMVFVDGRFLHSAGWEGEVNENSYFIDYDAGLVHIGVDPSNKLVEITAFNVALLRTVGECHGKQSDKKGPVVKGIAFTQYAYRAIEVEGTEPNGISPEADHGKEVVGTTFEHCSITFCSRVAAYFRGDKLTLRNCFVSETSTEGIYIIASNDVLLERNIFSRNNIEDIHGYYPAAVKIFNQSYRVTCRDNLVMDLPKSNGIWYDVGNVDGVFVNNWVQDVGNPERRFAKNRPWPSESGFFFEISKKVIVAGNVFVNCDQGIFILNSAGAKIYNNTLYNSMVCIGRNERTPANDGTFGWHSGTGPDVDKRTGQVFTNNLMVKKPGIDKPLLLIWQPDTFYRRNYTHQLDKLEGNVFVRSLVTDTIPVVYWTQAIKSDCRMAFQTLEGIQKLYPEFSNSNQYFVEIPVFKSIELGNFQQIKAYDLNKNAISVPEVSKLIGLPDKDIRYAGAYVPGY
jgi:parallel beta-helix repeat protein